MICSPRWASRTTRGKSQWGTRRCLDPWHVHLLAVLQPLLPRLWFRHLIRPDSEPKSFQDNVPSSSEFWDWTEELEWKCCAWKPPHTTQHATVEGWRSQFYGTPRFRLNYMAHCDYHPKQTPEKALGFWSGTIPAFLGHRLIFVWRCSRYRDWDQMVRTLCDLSSLQRPPSHPSSRKVT